MWRISRGLLRLRKFCTSSSTSSSSEEELQNLGIVVRHLPKVANLSEVLSNHFETSSVSIHHDIEGSPAYAVLKYDSELVYEQALQKNKSRVEGSKVYIESLESFRLANKPINGGFDSRKVIVYNLYPGWEEEKVIEMFKKRGSIMSLQMPRDYEIPPQFVDFKFKIPVQHMKFSKRTKSESGHSNDDAVSIVRRYIDRHSEILFNACNTETSKSVFDDAYDLWALIREIKDEYQFTVTKSETQIDQLFNSFIGKQSSDDDKASLKELIGMIKLEGTEVMNKFFGTKGIAYITFARRIEAERAIVICSLLDHHQNMKANWDRDIPEYFFHQRLLDEAHEKELYRVKSKSENKKKLNRFNYLLKHYENQYDTYINKHLEYKIMYFASDDEGDPVVKGLLNSYEEAAEYAKGVFNNVPIQKQGYNRDPTGIGFRKEVISSDEEMYEDGFRQGRITSKTYGINEKLMTKYIERASDIKDPLGLYSYSLPRKVPPELYADPSDVAKRLEYVESFFKDALPAEVKEKPEILQQIQYPDAPEVRFSYKQLFNYSKVPGLEDELASEAEEIFGNTQENWIKEEEEWLFSKEHSEQIIVMTDSDEEMERKAQIYSHPDYISDDEEAMRRIQIKLKDIEMMDSVLSMKSDLAVTKSYIYEGDVEAHVKELREMKNFEADYERNMEGDNVVLVKYQNKFTYDLDTYEKLYNKYWKSQEQTDTIQVDPEDLPLLEQLENGEVDLHLFYKEISTQRTEKHMREHFNSLTDLEKAEKYKFYHIIDRILKEDEERKRMNKS